MAMKKTRIVLVVVILAILGGLTVGGVSYVRNRNRQKLLVRVELAVRAGQFERALEHAQAYIDLNPEAWGGYYHHSRVLIRMGRFAQAREQLQRSAEYGADAVRIQLAMAETYTVPAEETLSAASESLTEAVLHAVLEQLSGATGVLERGDDVRILEARGLNLVRIGQVENSLADWLDQEAQVAASAREQEQADHLRQRSAAVAARGAQALEEAYGVLMQVAEIDLARGQAAEALVRLGLDAGDPAKLADLRRRICTPEHPAPTAEVLLWNHDISQGEELDEAAFADLMAEAVRAMDEILALQPALTDARLLRARLALGTGDLEAAQHHVTILLEEAGRDPFVRMTHARLLYAQGNLSQAEQELFTLRTDYPGLLAAHLLYAEVVTEVGRAGLARDALRMVTRIDPLNPQARIQLAEYFLREGFYQEAQEEVLHLHEVADRHPQTIPVIAEAALRSGQVGLGREVLGRLRAVYAENPPALMALADGHRLLGDMDQARDLAGQVAQIRPRSAGGRLAVARALVVTGQTDEALALLEQDQDATGPLGAAVATEMGQIHRSAGRVLDALMQFRRAAELAPRNTQHVLRYAQALLDNGQVEQSQDVLARVPADEPSAELLRVQVRVLLGEPVESGQLIDQVRGGQREGLPLAMVYLRHGQPAAAAAICELELERDPRDEDARLLLGQAYLAMGEYDKCIAQWRQLLQMAPDRQATYMQLADVMGRTRSGEEVARDLAGISGARPSLVDLAVGGLFVQQGRHAQAAAVYQRILDRPETPEPLRGQVILRRTQALAQAGDVEQALEELGALAASPAWRSRAHLARAQLFGATGRGEQALPELRQARQVAGQQQGVEMLRQVALTAMRMGQPAEALLACEEVLRIRPDDARAYLLWAQVLSAAGQPLEAQASYRRAIELQPDDFAAHVALAQSLDAQGELLEAMDVLERLEAHGATGQAVALFQQGTLLTRWGLTAPAMRRFESLRGGGYDDNPQVRVAMGRGLALLGQRQQASELLAGVPASSPQYVQARRLMAELADSPAGRLEILRAMAQSHPGALPAIGEMTALLGTGDLDGVLELCLHLAQSTGQPGWVRLAVLLMMDSRPQEAVAMLPPAGETDGPMEALLGLAAAGIAQDDAMVDEWMARWRRFESGANGQAAVSAPPRYALLAALLDDSDQVPARVEACQAAGFYWYWAAQELAQAVSEQRASRREVGLLLRATLAADTGLGQAGRDWAMQILQERPSCQWAAALVFAGSRDTSEGGQIEQVVDRLEPADSSLASLIRASLLHAQAQYEHAAEIFADLVERHPQSLDLRLHQAGALEKAGRLDEALAIYLDLYRQTRHPIAANNAAYVMALLYPQDADRLAEAQDLAEQAHRAVPSEPACLDTVGWIAYLRDEYDTARRYLRAAVQGLPTSPDIHYHLGRAEAAAGEAMLARWHLQAAIDLGERLQEQDPMGAADAARVVEQARQALAQTMAPATE